MAQTKQVTPAYEDVVREIMNGKFHPVYCLMGEEEYYIDKIADLLLEKLLTPDEQAFNLFTFYGTEATADAVVSAARGFPMGAERLVVCLKEAQNMKQLDKLELYFAQMQPTTVLIICHKGGNLDRRKKLPALIEKNGVLFESKPLREDRIPGFVASYLKRKGLAIELEAAGMVADLVGTKLTKVVNELDKLCVGLPKGQTMVTKEQILATIGVSREFNIFELQDALAKKDVSQATRIARAMAKDEREFYLPATLTMLFRFFSQIMLAYYAPEKSSMGIANWLGVHEWPVKKNIIPAMKVYTGVKVMNIISKIRETDARCKGIENGGATNAELFSELIYFILH